MAEIDPVILQLRADVDKYITDLRQTTTKVDDLLGRQEKQVRALEDQFRESGDAIKGHLTSLAAAMAAAFSTDKIIAYADAYTRFQNSLKVAGLAGSDLVRIQEQLFAIANKNGVSIETIGGLYGKAAQNSNVLGASQADLIKLTETASYALKVSGASAEGASGALLGMTQALGSSRVQTEDFNQMLEGGLLPLLQEAAKHITGTGGTVAGLKQKLGDMKTAGVSNVELFQAIIKSLDAMEKKAALASGTIGAAFEHLNNEMTKYVGQADQAEGATAILTGAIVKLADNLATIIPTLATIAVFLGARYTVGMAAAAIATIAKVAADVRATQSAAALAAAQVELAGMMGIETLAAERAAAAVTGLAVAQGVAARGGSALLAVVGGPIGLALIALGAALYYAKENMEKSQPPAQQYAKALDASTDAGKKAKEMVDSLTSAHGKERDALLEKLKARRQDNEEMLKSARLSLALAKAELSRAMGAKQAAADAAGGDFGEMGRGGITAGHKQFNAATEKAQKAQADVDAAQKTVDGYQEAINTISAGLNAAEFKPAAAAVKAKKQKGPTAAQIEAKHEEEMARLQQEELQAQLDITTDSSDRAQISRQILTKEYNERATKINADKYFTKAQKAAQIAELNKLYGVRGTSANGEIVVDGSGGLLGKSITREENEADEKREADIAKAQYDAQKDALQALYDLADSTDERRRIALEMVDLDYKAKRAQEQAIVDSKVASQTEKDAASAQIKVLDDQVSGKRTAANRANESPLQTYTRGLNKSDGAINDQVEGYVVDELNSVRDSIRTAITKQLGITDDPLINGLLNMLIEQILLKPIANALSNAKDASASGGGGIFGSVLSGFGAIFGRASGGAVQAGQMYRVNEAANSGNVEAFVPNVSGQIIPLGRTNATRAGGGGDRVFQISVDARNSVTPAGFAQSLSSTILQQAAAMDVQMGQAVSGAVPGRIQQYQRDGN